ncbi:MAG: lipoyl synthase [Elusimicrobia bacterium]|nr:lipoyl synthase [Elusimicrobiota bacterium]
MSSMSAVLTGTAERLPSWLRVRPPSGENAAHLQQLGLRLKLNTVCIAARCPNMAECWQAKTATFMIMGGVCTRACRFCSVQNSSKPASLDADEPGHLAEAAAELELNYAVITSVCRDDLEDQGAGHFAECIRAVKTKNPSAVVEVLIPDFRGDLLCLQKVLEAGPDVIGHNLETVERSTPHVRDRRAGYRQSLGVLNGVRGEGVRSSFVTCYNKLWPPFSSHQQVTNEDLTPLTKSGIMVGLGETDEERIECFKDMRQAGVDILTIGQYLRPTNHPRHLAVREYVAPEKFQELKKMAEDLGFLGVASGPFVRSSYQAAEMFNIIKKAA